MMCQEIYENMKVRVENVVNRGEVSEIYISNDEEREAFNKWTGGFTPQDHPTVIQVCIQALSFVNFPFSKLHIDKII